MNLKYIILLAITIPITMTAVELNDKCRQAVLKANRIAYSMRDAAAIRRLADIRGITYDPAGTTLAEYKEVLPELKEYCPAELYEYYVTYKDYVEVLNLINDHNNDVWANVSNDSDFMNNPLIVNFIKSSASFGKSLINLPEELKKVVFKL